MAKRICIQSGHINCQNNSIVELRNSTGAPGEQELTLRIANRLAAVLRSKGFDCVQSDSNANDDFTITGSDWDLFLALHGDADYAGDSGSGFAAFPDPATDGASFDSQRIAGVINTSYFPEVGIVYKDRSNNNTRYYYMWKYLSASTPCVLVEMGQVQDAHDKVLLANTDLIANALGRAICKAFNIPFDLDLTPTPTPTPAPVPSPGLEIGLTPSWFSVLLFENGLSLNEEGKMREFFGKAKDFDGKVSELTAMALNRDHLTLELTVAQAALTTAQDTLKNVTTKIYGILYGKGWPWSKINALKVIFPKS